MSEMFDDRTETVVTSQQFQAAHYHNLLLIQRKDTKDSCWEPNIHRCDVDAFMCKNVEYHSGGTNGDVKHYITRPGYHCYTEQLSDTDGSTYWQKHVYVATHYTPDELCKMYALGFKQHTDF